jgi:hypothetical protein
VKMKLIQVPGNLYVTRYDPKGRVVLVSSDIRAAKRFTSAAAGSFLASHGEAHQFDRSTAQLIDAPVAPTEEEPEMGSY